MASLEPQEIIREIPQIRRRLKPCVLPTLSYPSDLVEHGLGKTHAIAALSPHGHK
ncbi:unnamed protein product, partial [Gulo gulo]